MRNAALYIRKSTTTKQKNSLEVQLEGMAAYCEGHFTPVEVFSDQQTGRTLERSGLKAAFEWLDADSTRVLVFYKVDRYARTIDMFQGIRKFIENDQIRFMDLQQPSDKADMLMIQLRLMIGENESTLIGNRISNTIKHLQSQGRAWGGTPEHMASMRDSSLKVRKANADDYALKVMDVVSLFVQDDHLTQAQLVENLNKIGFTTRRGSKWTQPTLAKALGRARKLKGC